MYRIFLTPRANKQLMFLARENKKLYLDAIDTLDRLSQGHWQGGTRVKKLQGVNDLFEARLNSGDRLLFTKQLEDLYIQFVYLVHDDVNIKARTTFLSSEGSTIYPNSDRIEEFEIPSEKIHSIQSSIVLDRSFLLDEEEFTRMALTEDLNSFSLKLKLLPEQEEALLQPMPLVLSGSAGSGKTVVCIYRLLYEASQLLEVIKNPKLIYITQNERLAKEAEEQYHFLCHNRDNEAKLLSAVDFHSFHSLLGTYAMDKYHLFIDRESFISEFSIYQQGNYEARKLLGLAVYEEIHSLIGAMAIPDKRFLFKEEYLSLQDFESPIFVKNRKLLWQIHEWYEDLKRSKGYYDLNDMIFHVIRNETLEKYDLLVCDELQDFNSAQIYFSLLMLKEERKAAFLLAGDSKQTINESQFSWQALKRLLNRKFQINKIPQFNLSINHRNPKPIAELSESLFHITKEYGIKESPGKVQAPLEGKEAIFVREESHNWIKYVSNLQNINSVVIVPDKVSEQNLIELCIRQGYQPPFILLPHEAKGLEFQEVWLWSLVGINSHRWQALIKKRQLLEEHEKRFITMEIRKLYVSLTRTLYNVYIIDPFGDFLWLHDKLKPLSVSEHKNLQELVLSRRSSYTTSENNEENWTAFAIKFFEDGEYQRCLECLERLQKMNKLNTKMNKLKKLAFANLLLTEGKFEEAGEIFFAIKDYKKAVNAYDHGGLFKKISTTLNMAAFEAGITTKEGKQFAYERDMYKVREFDRKQRFDVSGRLSLRYTHYYEAAFRFKKSNRGDLLEECLVQGLESHCKDERFLNIAINYFKQTMNHERQTQALKIKMKLG